MRYCLAVIGLSAWLFCALAQDGLYGSFLFGQKYVDLTELNNALSSMGYNDVEFPTTNWTYGGEGHLVIGKRYMIGGKAFGIMHERVSDVLPTDTCRMRITGGLGLLTLGFSLVPPNPTGIRLYPQLGLGLSSFIFQKKNALPEDATFNSVVKSTDSMVTIGKTGWAIDVGVGLDWYKPFKNFFTIIRGLDLGPMLHVECGYTFIPQTLNWLRDVSLSGTDNLTKEPDLKFGGFYWNVGIGIGLSPRD